MPAEVDAPVRRSVVPAAAGRSLWLSAVWTGLGPAILGAVLGILGVALCWLPASGTSGNAGSVFRAGVLVFLAAVHGGITVDGVPSHFVPLGLTGVVALVAWRAGTGLADAAAELAEQRTDRLVRAAALQVASFAVTCSIAARLSVLGTSHVSMLGALLAGALLFAVSGSVAFTRGAGLLRGRLPASAPTVVRGAAAVALTWWAGGALLVAGSLAVHRGRVELLSASVGHGWGGAPVLLLGILAAPNAAVAAASYLAGPGFAVGSGTTVSLVSAGHGTVPAFPVLGAIPTGPAGSAAWLLAAATPVAAGWALVRVVRREAAGRQQWLRLGGGAAVAALAGLVAAWLAGGSIGTGRLSAVGASPWRFGLVSAGWTAVVAAVSLAAVSLLERWRRRREDADVAPPPALRAVSGVFGEASSTDAEGSDQLAG